jgi:hypothetical protein
MSQERMQPQDTGNSWDLSHILSGVGGALGAISAVIVGIFRAGAKEPTIKADFLKDLTDAEKRVEDKIEAAEKRAEVKIESLADQFRESFAALRQKINDVEKDGVNKEEFNHFRHEHREDFQGMRKEIREDFAELKRNVASLLGNGHKT